MTEATSRSVLIAGGTGLLGSALIASAPDEWGVRATYHHRPPPPEWRSRFSQMDVCDDAQVLDVIRRAAPAVVVHAASVGSVDQAEQDPAGVRRINIGGLQAIGRACERVGARLLFVSSNAVFDGHHPPYDESAPRAAVNEYGRLKIEAEEWLEGSGVPHTIVRPILMYGWPLPGGRSNAVTRWLADFDAGRPVKVAEDIRSMPLLASNAADAIWAAIRLDRRGVYHVAGADHVSLVDFARETARVFGYREDLVTPVPSASFTALAPRPLDTSFVTTKMECDLGVRPMGIREGLLDLLRTRALTG
jgi:dTDP-4-dehydrorhamnose reductase